MRTANAPILSLLLLLAASCQGADEPWSYTVGNVPVADAALAGLEEAERQAFADLTGLGLSIVHGEVDVLVAPVVEREAGAAAVAALPYRLGADRMGMGEDQLRSVYAREPESELVVRHLVRLVSPGAPRERREDARAVAATAAERARAGEDFAALAAEYSEEPGADVRGGLLQPGRQGSWVEPFWNAAAALAPGEVSGVVESEYGYHVIRLDERRAVPFEEASLSALLRRAVPAAVASAAMEEWAARNAAVLLDPPAVAEARARLAAGFDLPDTLAIARGVTGGSYSGERLTAGWARLAPAERTALERADEVGFAAWLEAEAREAIWADLAAGLGIAPPAAARDAALAEWRFRITQWGRALGFREGMSDAQVVGAALLGVRSGAAEARAARQEVRSLRPRLRRLHPFLTPEKNARDEG